MATWGGLNAALTSWRAGIVRRFPKRGSASDGGVADKAHGKDSQHQRDADSTVDAFDCDVNWLGSSDPDGNALEDRFSEAVKADFEDDPRAQLWIHNREIANRAIGDWRERYYGGASAHDHHIHFETRQALEDDGRPWAMPRTDALLRELNGDHEMTPDQLLDALETDRGQALLARAAGQGVHNQKLFRTDVTIGTAVQQTNRGVTEIKDAIAQPPA